MQRTQNSPFRWIKPLKNFSETWLFLLIRTHYFKWLSNLFITKWVFYYKINNYSNIALGVSPYMVKTSAANSWLCWVWRSLSFFLSTDSPLNTIVSGLNEPQDYKIQNSNMRLVLDLKLKKFPNAWYSLASYEVFTRHKCKLSKWYLTNAKILPAMAIFSCWYLVLSLSSLLMLQLHTYQSYTVAV